MFDLEKDINLFKSLRACNDYFRLVTKINCSQRDNNLFIVLDGKKDFERVINNEKEEYFSFEETPLEVYIRMQNLVDAISCVTISKNISHIEMLEEARIYVQDFEKCSIGSMNIFLWLKLLVPKQLDVANPYLEEIEKTLEDKKNKVLCK